MLTIINDPTGATGWQRHAWDLSKTIQENIEAHMPDGEGCAVRLNGLPIDPSRDLVMDLPPKDDDEMIVSKRPEGFDPFTWVIIAAVAMTAVMYTLIPKIQPINSADTPKDSPNNRLTAQTNSARAYQGIPDVYGRRRVWPDLIQPSVVEYINNIKYVTELMCISRGDGIVSDVRFSDTPIYSIGSGANSIGSGVSFEIFKPSPGNGYAENRQTVVPNVVEAFSVPDVDGQELSSYTASENILINIIGPFVMPLDVQSIRWNIVFPRGLKGTVNILVKLWKISDNYVEIAGTRQNLFFNYSDNTFDARYFTEEVSPSAGSGLYKISFQRLNVENGNGTDVAKLESLFGIKKYSTKSFPGVTLIRVTTKATESATSFRERKINVRWDRYVRELNSEVVTGSGSFARAIVHMWVISGRDLAQLDVGALERINAEEGWEGSSLLQFNGSLDDADMSLGERVRLIADHARCLVWRNGSKWTFTRDSARPYPVMQLDYLNMAPSEPSMSYSAHLPSTHDGVELEYVDPVSQSRKAYVRLNISSGAPVDGQSANPLKIRLSGCTNTAQARDRAKVEALRLVYQRQSLKVHALGEALDLGPGSLIRWVDPDDFYADDKLQAGEVIGIDGPAVICSEVLRWDGAKQGRILFTGANGKYIGPPVICYRAEGGVRLSSKPAGLFVASGAQQVGSRYVFAVGLTDSELESASLWTVVGTTPNTDGTVSVSCVNYDKRIYGA